jgi:hypothetical protein
MRTAALFLCCSLLGPTGRALAQACEAPDAYEPNDDCLAAVTLSAGAALGLTVQGAAATTGPDADHYAVSVAPGEALQVDAIFSTSLGDIDLELFADSSCLSLVDASYSLSDDEHVDYVNTGGAPEQLVLVVSGFGAGFTCNDYDLLVVLGPDPCAALLSDPAEDNDDCSMAAPLFGGLTEDLNVSLTDPDWYHIALGAGASLAVELHFTHAQGDLDLRIWDGCPITGLSPFGSSESETDDEWVGFGNSSDLPVDLWIEVYVWSGSMSACNDYDLLVTLEGGEPAVALCFGDGSDGMGCPCGNLGAAGEGCANSTGSGAVLTATGTNVHANDDLVLHVAGARPNQPGMAIQGGALSPIAFRDGILCLGTPTERLEVISLDATGAAETSLSIVTQGGIPGPGTTAFYQVWYRDPVLSVCGLGSNLSQALRVDWN